MQHRFTRLLATLLFVVTALALPGLKATAQEKKGVWIPNIQIQPGEEKVIDVNFNFGDKTNTTAFQFFINLPEGLTPVKMQVTPRKQGWFKPNEDVVSTDTHSINSEYLESSHEIRVLVYSTDLDPLYSFKGIIGQITLKAADNYTGSGTITMTDAVISASGGEGGQIEGENFPPETTDIYIPVTSIALNKTSASLARGESETLTVTFTPANSTGNPVTWTSSNEAVATVAADGTVTAAGAGSATITAESRGKTATCRVTVTVPLNGISLNKTEANVVMGTTEQLSATLDPADATGYTVTWTSSDPTVATVSNTGLVTPKKAGSTDITATAGSKSATCRVTVTLPTPTGITFTPAGPIDLKVGAEKALPAATVTPQYAEQGVAWTTSDATIARIDGSKVIGVKAGTATLTATSTANPAVTKTLTVNVTNIDVLSVKITSGSGVVEIGKTRVLKGTVTPGDATIKTLAWTSSNDDIATVNNEGVVTGVSVGTVTITATSVSNTDIKGTFEITVQKPAPTSITLTPSGTINLKVGDEIGIPTVNVEPTYANDAVNIKIADETIATIRGRKIAALKAGRTTYTVTSVAAPTVSVSVDIIVTDIEVERVAITAAEEVFVGETITATATITPENATFKTVTWSTSNPAVATVSDQGVITGVKAGTATITATAVGGKTATKSVTVKNRLITAITVSGPQGVDLTKVKAGNSVQLSAVITPDNATVKTLTWAVTPADGGVTVDRNGLVTVGNTPVLQKYTITATPATGAAEAGVTGTAELTVVATPAESITIAKATASASTALKAGETLALTATVLPATTTDKNVAWSITRNGSPVSGDDAAVSISAEGVVTVADRRLTPAELGSYKAVAAATANASTATATFDFTLVKTPVVTVTVAPAAVSLEGGQEQAFTATVLPATATYPDVTWTIADNTVATINGNIVTARTGVTGETTVTATADGVKGTAAVKVVPVAVKTVTITAPADGTELKAGNSTAITATVAPDNATDKTLTWTTTNPEYVSVVDNKIVVADEVPATKLGDVTVTATATSGVTATVTIKLVKTPVERISITAPSPAISLLAGQNANLPAVTFNPANATNKEITWSVSKDGTDVTADGPVTIADGKISVADAVSKEQCGTYTITATSADNNAKTAYFTITVAETPVASVTPADGQLTGIKMLTGQTHQLAVTIAPAATTDKTVTWTTEGTGVTVDTDGLLTATAAGNATVKASVTSGGVTKTATFTVAVATEPLLTPEDGVDVENNKAQIAAREEARFNLNTTVGPVEWTIIDEVLADQPGTRAANTVAEVITSGIDEDGAYCIVKGIAMGTATLQATVNGKTVTYGIDVTKIMATELTLDVETSMLVYLNTTTTITASLLPEDATIQEVEWTLSDTKYVRNVVTEPLAITFTAAEPGDFTITAGTTDGSGLTKTVKVMVRFNTSGIDGIEAGNGTISHVIDMKGMVVARDAAGYEALDAGFYIIVNTDGTRVKVLKK